MITNKEHAMAALTFMAKKRGMLDLGVALRDVLVASANAADRCGTVDPAPAAIAGRLLRGRTTGEAIRRAELVLQELRDLQTQERK